MDSPSSVSVSKPRLTRTLSDHPSPSKASSSRLLVNESSAIDSFVSANDSNSGLLDNPNVTASSASLRRDPFSSASLSRSTARSISSNAVPTLTSIANAKKSLSPLQVNDLADHPGRGPGTPDFTLSTVLPPWRRADHEKARTVASLGQGLQLISDAETSMLDPVNSSATHSSSTAESNRLLSRPSLATFRSLFSPFSSSSPSETANQPPDQNSQTPSASAHVSRPQPLVIPSARPAGPEGLYGFNADSPPLTPTSDTEDANNEYPSKAKSSPTTQRQARHGAPKHQWSAAQAAADAAHFALESGQNSTSPYLSQWPFTPPLTTSSGGSSPAASSRPLSPPIRPASIATHSGSQLHGLLPSHLVSSLSSRPPTPDTTLTTSSERSVLSISAWDRETYKVENLTKIAWSLLPRIYVNPMSWRLSFPPLRPYLPRLLVLFAIFVCATSCIVFMLSTLPLSFPRHLTSLTLSEIKQFALSLKQYSQSSSKAWIHTWLAITALFTWKQSFTIPGSLIMNIVFGAMYGTYSGTLYTCVFTCVGGVFCYLLSAPLAPLIISLPGLAKPLDAMRRALSPARAPRRGNMNPNSKNGSDGNVWTYLLVLRIVPIIPSGVMNIACGVLSVPLLPYAATLAVGSIPWNFVTCQVGDILQEIVEALPVNDVTTVSNKTTGSTGGGMKVIVSHIWNREMMIKLILLSAASLLPMVLGRYLKSRQQQQQQQNQDEYEPLSSSEEEMVEQRSDEENDRNGSLKRPTTTSIPLQGRSVDMMDWYQGNPVLNDRDDVDFRLANDTQIETSCKPQRPKQSGWL